MGVDKHEWSAMHRLWNQLDPSRSQATQREAEDTGYRARHESQSSTMPRFVARSMWTNIGRNVRYGDRAVVARKDTGTPCLYESSPKLWLKEPGRLGEAAAPGLSLTREHLLAGLLAYAVACSGRGG
jgi:hypothetical protein